MKMLARVTCYIFGHKFPKVNGRIADATYSMGRVGKTLVITKELPCERCDYVYRIKNRYPHN